MIEKKRWPAFRSVDRVRAEAREQLVVPVSPEQRVVATPPVDDVVASESADDVIP